MGVVVIGIDPGKDGFISIRRIDGSFEFIEMPEHKVPTGKISKTGREEMKSEFNPAGFVEIVDHIKEEYQGFKILGCIEEVQGRQGWSATNNFNFGHTAGLQYSVLSMIGAEIEMVKPQKWQSFMYNGFCKTMKPSSTGKTMVHDTKATSAIVAQQLAPEIDFRKTERSKEIHDGKTDSFLICMYRYQRYLQGK